MLEALSLTGKIVVITGGGTGLGREMTLAMAKAGADLVIAARRLAPIEEVAQQVRAIGRRAEAVPTDATDTESVRLLFEHVIKEFGKVDILFNNAGIVREDGPKPIWEITDDSWRIGIDVNLSTAFYCSRAISKHMADRGSGKIVNVSSGYGFRGGRDNYMYAAGKGGIVNLTR
nr:SDR family oxidoreductase [Dehalococcoidia bacterium]